MNATYVDRQNEMKLTVELPDCKAPVRFGQEWANALTHGLAAVVGAFGAGAMIWHTSKGPLGTMLSCLAFVVPAIAVFIASTLSHTFLNDTARLKRYRAWDQGLIYAMISGTYTPLVYHYADPSSRNLVIVAIWVAAAIGFYSKVFAKHRINSIGTATYLALGWLPALALVGRVPSVVLVWMSLGGVIYTLGVVLLINDHRIRYLHAVWHIFVVVAASCHYWAIYRYVVVAAA
jgi:hemolysin III